MPKPLQGFLDPPGICQFQKAPLIAGAAAQVLQLPQQWPFMGDRSETSFFDNLYYTSVKEIFLTY
jgi:hypothetical protein